MQGESRASRGIFGVATIAVAASVVLSGCNTAGLPSIGNPLSMFSDTTTIDEASLTPAQRQMRERSEAFNRTVWEGVAAGAVVGAIAGALIADDDPLAGAAIGGVAGGVIGGLAGSYIAERQAEYADEEDLLDAMISDVRLKNTEAAELVQSMEVVLAEDRRQLALLQQQRQADQITAEEYEGKLAIIRSDQEQMTESHESAKEQLKTFQEARDIYKTENPGTSTAKMDTELATLQSRIDSMGKIVDGLGSAELG